MKIFLSFHYDQDNRGQEQFVYRVSYYLRKQSDVEAYCYTGDPTDKSWREYVGPAVMKYDKFVLFVGKKLGPSQETEADHFIDKHNNNNIEIRNNACSVFFYNDSELPGKYFQFKHIKVDENICDVNMDSLTYEQEEAFEAKAQGIAKEIVLHFLKSNEEVGKPIHGPQSWIPSDGLPIGYPFGYEKKIIEEFVAGSGRLFTPQRLAEGCPINWPKVMKIGTPVIQNPITVSERGDDRPEENSIVVDVMGFNHCKKKFCLVERKLTFPEAGPRKTLFYPNNRIALKVGIVVSGGIAPGINAVINGIVQRHLLYNKGHNERRDRRYNLLISMYRDGFEGIRTQRQYDLNEIMLRDQSTFGGSMINTSRFDELLDIKNRGVRDDLLTEVVKRLAADNIDILYVIGGDGSMRAAHAIYTRAEEMFWSTEKDRKINRQISVVAIPKTMDNDVLWVWQSFGFLSAVEKAKEFIIQLNTEAKSNPRLCIVQLFGSDSGFVVSHAALASGACMAALIPEVSFTMKKLSSDITRRLWDKYTYRDTEYSGQSPYGLVLLGETAIPQDVEDYIDKIIDYPDLGLEEGEKEAIRKFMGSSLLCRADVCNWKSLADELNNSPDGSPCRRLLDLLPSEVKGILRETLDLKDENLKSLVLLSINNILKREDFYEPEAFKSISFMTELKEVAGILDQVKKITSTERPHIEGNDIKSLVQKLINVPISCEAREIVNLLEIKSREGDDWNKISRHENLSFFQQLRKRLTEKFNRLLLEKIFSDQIIARSSSIQRDRRVQGQTPDELRKGGVKIVSGVLKQDIQSLGDVEGYFRKYRVFVNEPRHLIRAITPSVSDVIFGQRLGILAVDNAMAGYTDFMISQWLTEFVLVPLKLAVLGRKRVPPNGIFWKSVLAGTGQAPDMIRC